MERKAAFILATPPGFNPGMMVSELTSMAFCKRHGIKEEAAFYRLLPLEDRLARHYAQDDGAFSMAMRRCDTGIPFQSLPPWHDIPDACPVFWGDFLHMRQYVRAVGRLLPQSDPGAAMRVLLMRDAPPPMVARAVSFGTTMLFNCATDHLDAEYGPALRSFVQGCRLMLVRDMASAAQLDGIKPECHHWGLDAAQMLVLETDWRDLFPSGTVFGVPGAKGGAVFFARSQHKGRESDRVVEHLSALLDVRFGWLEWGDAAAFPYLNDGNQKWPSLTPHPLPHLPDLLAAVAASKVVVTDTYHLAVIAWAMGVPALMVMGEYWDSDPDVNAGPRHARLDKRYVFYAQHGLLEFLIAPETARDDVALTTALTRLVPLILDGQIAHWHQSQIRAKARLLDRQLAAALSD